MTLVGTEVETNRTRRAFGLATVAIVYGDPVVGQALALLLQGTDYNVKFKHQSYLEDLSDRSELLHGTQMLILVPGINVERREEILALLKSNSATEHILVMELGLPPEGSQARVDHYVPWPIRTEDLKRYIDVALAENERTIEPRTQIPEENEERA